MYKNKDLAILESLYQSSLRKASDALRDNDTEKLKHFQRESYLILVFIKSIESGELKYINV